MVLDPTTREPLDIAHGGVAVWDRLKHPATASEIARDLAASHQEDADAIHRDVSALLERLYGLGLVMRA